MDDHLGNMFAARWEDQYLKRNKGVQQIAASPGTNHS